MHEMIALQRWLYESMASGLREAAAGGTLALAAALGAAMVFGILHALMPGHGKTVLFSYHLGEKSSLLSSVANGAILVLTHVGTAVVLVLTGFAVMARAFAYGGRTPQFEMASGVLVALIGTFLLWRASTRAAHGELCAGVAPRNGKALAFATGLVPCPLTTFISELHSPAVCLRAGLAITAAWRRWSSVAGVAVLATISRDRLMAFFSRTEGTRRALGRLDFEIGGGGAVLLFGAFLILSARAASEPYCASCFCMTCLVKASITCLTFRSAGLALARRCA